MGINALVYTENAKPGPQAGFERVRFTGRAGPVGGPSRLEVLLDSQLDNNAWFVGVFRVVRELPCRSDPAQVQPKHVHRHQVVGEASDCDPNPDRLLDVAVEKISVVKSDIPCVGQSAVNRGEDGRLRRVTWADQGDERLIGRDSPRKELNSSKVLNIDSSNLH
jgi:hypothetical protein